MSDHGGQGERGRTGEAGSAGETGAAGDVGARGEAGPAGRQGEAGVSGREGQAGTAGQAGAEGARGRTGRAMSSRQAVAGFLVVITAFTALAFRTEIQARQIHRNQNLIARNQYDQCTALNVAARRQHTLVDSAVAAEQRKPAPDRQRIADLTAGKTPLLDCGAAP